MSVQITELGHQENTKRQSRRTNAAVRAVQDVFGVSQKAAQGPAYRFMRLVAYSALRQQGAKG